MCNPTKPAACRAAVESVAETSQLLGSTDVTGQAFARTVVGAVPVTASRTRIARSVDAVTPATVAVASAVEAFETVRATDRDNDPPAFHFSMAR